jgi:hypothetical protein
MYSKDLILRYLEYDPTRLLNQANEQLNVPLGKRLADIAKVRKK